MYVDKNGEPLGSLVRSESRRHNPEFYKNERNRREWLEQAARLIIVSCGGDPDEDPHFKGTPTRFADMFIEEFIPNGTIVEALEEMVVDESYDQMIVIRDIPIRSMCPHHLLPWFGRATIGYIPDGKIIGLSKVTRAVEAAARGPQIQEAVTSNIVGAMDQVLEPLGSACTIEAVHMCTLMRGVKTELQKFTTSANSGVFREKPETRQEFMTLFSRGQSMQW